MYIGSKHTGLNLVTLRFMVFNATFNSISVISWQSVLLVEETGIPRETTDLSQVIDNFFYIMLYRGQLAMKGPRYRQA